MFSRDHEQGEADDAFADEQNADDGINSGEQFEIPRIGRGINRLGEEGHPAAVEGGGEGWGFAVELILGSNFVEDAAEHDGQEKAEQCPAEFVQDGQEIEGGEMYAAGATNTTGGDHASAQMDDA